MGELYAWGAGFIGVVVAVIMAWFTGRSKGKAIAEKKSEEQRTREMINTTKVVAERQVTASREAANVDQKVNNSTISDVDKQLHDKWTRPGSR